MKIILLLITYITIFSQASNLELTYSRFSSDDYKYKSMNHFNIKYLKEVHNKISSGLDISYSKGTNSTYSYLKIGIPVYYPIYKFKTTFINGGFNLHYSTIYNDNDEPSSESFFSLSPQINIKSEFYKNMGVSINLNYSFFEEGEQILKIGRHSGFPNEVYSEKSVNQSQNFNSQSKSLSYRLIPSIFFISFGFYYEL